MSILARTRVPAERRSTMQFTQGMVVPRPSVAAALGYQYDPNDAYRIAAVIACVGLRAGAFVQLPMFAARMRDGVAVRMDVQPELLDTPSDLVVRSAWKAQMSISRDIYGYAAGLIKAVDAAGYPKRVDWQLPKVDIVPIEVGERVEWRLGGLPIDPDRIFHVPSRWVLPGRPLGISPLEYSGLADLARKAQDFGRDWFRNGAVPSSIIYSDQELNSDQVDALTQTVWQKWRKRMPAVIGSGLRYEKVAVAANESQFLETIRQAAADIALSFNLPPAKVGAAVAAGSTLEYANRDQNQQDFLVDSINPDLVVIAEVFERATPRGQLIDWDTSKLLRSDEKTRAEVAKLWIDSGVKVPDELRAPEGLLPLPDGLGKYPRPAVLKPITQDPSKAPEPNDPNAPGGAAA